MDNQSKMIKKSSTTVIYIFIAIIIGRVLGFVRESAMAAAFGIGPEVDAFIVAQSITFMLFSFIGPAIATSSIPVLSRLYSSGHIDKFTKVTWSLFHVILIVSGIFSTIGYLITPFIVAILAPGFELNQLRIAISLTQLMMPIIVFYAITGWASSVLNSKSSFGYSSLSYIPNNIVVIFGIFTASFFGGIEWVAALFVIGAVAQFVVQIPGFRGIGYKLSFLRKDNDLSSILKMIPSTIFTGLGAQINNVIDRIFASLLAVGSIAALGYSQKAFNLVVGLVQTPILTVLFPKLAEKTLDGNAEEFVKLVKKGMSILSFLVIPCALPFIILSIPITQILYERGAFNDTATLKTASALCIYSISIPFISWREYILRSFYALRETRVPIINTVLMIVITIVLNFLLVGKMGILGLALSSTVSSLISLCFLYYRFYQRYKTQKFSDLFISMAKSWISALLMGGALVYFSGMLGINIFERTSISKGKLTLFLFIAIGGSLIFYLLSAYLMRSPEIKYLINTIKMLRKRFFSKQQKAQVFDSNQEM